MLVPLTSYITKEFRGPPIFRISANSDVASVLDRHIRGTGGTDYFSGIENIPDEQTLVTAYCDYERERAIELQKEERERTEKMQEEEKERERKRCEGIFFKGFQKYCSNIHKLHDFIKNNSHLLYAVETKWFHAYLVGLSRVQRFAKRGLTPSREIGEIFIAELERRDEYNEVARQIWSKFLRKNFGEK